MPVTPKYEWSETAEAVRLEIQVPGLKRLRDADVFCSDVYLKVNRPPQLLAVDLHAPVGAEPAVELPRAGVLVVTLRKVAAHVWGDLRVAALSPAAVESRRVESVGREERRLEAAARARAERKRQLKETAQDRAWEAEKSHRGAIESLKSSEARAAADELESFSASVAREEEAKEAPPAAAAAAAAALPPVRAAGATIQVRFTQTKNKGAPARADKNDAGDAAHKRPAGRLDQAKAGGGADDDGTAAGGEHAVFLKERGDKFFRARVFDAALSAYTEALRKDPQFVACLTNRAACRLRQAEDSPPVDAREPLRLAASDCDRALRLLDDESLQLPAAQRRHLRGRALVRRGTAHAWLGDFRQALPDLREALALQPEDLSGARAALEADVARVAGLLEQAEAGDDERLHAEGDGAYRECDNARAVARYTVALALNPGRVATYANRAAAYLRVGQYEACDSDCTSAVRLLEEAGDYADRAQLARVLARRGAARAWLGRHAKALADVRRSASLWREAGGGSADAARRLADLEEDARRLEAKVDADRLQREGDRLYLARSMDEAAGRYTRALRLAPQDRVALANRSACHLCVGRYAECEADATAALEQLAGEAERAAADRASLPPLSEASPAWQRELERAVARREAQIAQWRRVCLVRRGSARVWRKDSDLAAGRADLAAAADLFRGVESQTDAELEQLVALEQDIERLDERIEETGAAAAAVEGGAAAAPFKGGAAAASPSPAVVTVG